jgi:ubiquinone/menaquinone biosynthesis C-methylase UbiE
MGKDLMETPDKVQPDFLSRNQKRWDAEADYDQRYQDQNHRAIFANSGYSNYGYWDENTRNAVHACDNLVDKLIATFREKNGTVLDVACGCGGSTKRLSRYFAPRDITAINISKYQVESTQARVPESRCLQMDAARLNFEAGTFNNILCVEAACCFRTRLRFFKEAYRVLKPGGTMALTDILVDTPPGKLQLLDEIQDTEEIPLANRVNAEVYRDMLEAAGFNEISMTGILNNTVKAFEDYSIGWVSHHFHKLEEVTAQQMLMYGRFMSRSKGEETGIKDYILVSAHK